MGWKLFARQSASSVLDSRLLLTEYRDKADPQLLTELFRRYADALYHFLLRQSDAELAQDLSQQCWVNLMQYASSYQGQSSVKTWLFAIGRHLLIDELRRQQRWQHVDDTDTLPDVQPTVLAQLQRTEAQQRLDKAIQLLPFVQREALILQLEEFSLEQISDICGAGVETVKTRLRYARQHLKTLLETVDDLE